MKKGFVGTYKRPRMQRGVKFIDSGNEFEKVWSALGDIPIDEDERIEEKFLHFEVGTDKYDIWHWIEEKYDVTLGDII